MACITNRPGASAGLGHALSYFTDNNAWIAPNSQISRACRAYSKKSSLYAVDHVLDSKYKNRIYPSLTSIFWPRLQVQYSWRITG